MFCPRCGTHCADDAKFCKSCGAPLGAPGAIAGAAPNAPSSGPAPAIPPAYGSAMAASASPSAAAAMKPKRSIAPFAIIAAIAAVAIIAVIVFVIKPFGSASTDQETNNISLAYGYATSADGWDYFFSDTMNGLYRAKTDGTVELVMQIPENNYGVLEYGMNYMSTDNGRLFFVKNSYTSTSSTNAICSMALDGTDVRTLFEGTSTNSETRTYPQSLYVYDHKLYMVICNYDDGSTSYHVMTMDEDGANQEELCTITDDFSGIVITPEKVYYTKNDYKSSGTTLGEIYSQNLDGTDFKQIYKSSIGTVYSLGVTGDRLVFVENNYDADKTVYTSIKTDGADANTVYQAQGGGNYDFLALAEGYLYFGVSEAGADDYNAGYEFQLARVPLDGGDLEALGGKTHYYPTATVSNGHLVVMSMGTGAGNSGYQVVAVAFDGEELATYVDYGTLNGSSSSGATE